VGEAGFRIPVVVNCGYTALSGSILKRKQESEELRLSPHFKSLLEAFVPSTANNILTEVLR